MQKAVHSSAAKKLAMLQRKVRPMNRTQPPYVAGKALQRSQRITVYPNLVTQKQFWLQFYYVDKCVFSVHLYTLTGIEVFRKFFHHSTYHATHAVQLPFYFGAGIYKLAIKSEHMNQLQPIVIR
jgi:hypothetical protein